LLDKAYKELPKILKEHIRFVIPKIQARIQGKTTVVQNLAEVSKGINRETSLIAKYLLREFGTMGSRDDQRLLMKGQFRTSQIQEKFESFAATLFGSGWTWLSLVDNKLIIENTPNQDSPYSLNHKPILTLDIWEHAYYLKYKNVRLDYIKNFWSVVNWNKVEENFKN